MNTSENSPHADVYAGDLSATNPVSAADEPIRFFSIAADSEAGTFARIANVLNLANTAPSSVILEVREAGRLSIYVEIGGIGLGIAQSIARKLTQLTDVIRVEMGTVP